jgi:SAM-dependent methyltransferase
MKIIFLIVVLLAVMFGGVLFVGAPYVPTLPAQSKAALDLLSLKPGQTLLELGSGDGTVLIAAAKAGLNVIGIELNPFLCGVSWLRTRKYHRQVHIICGDFWRVKWPETDGVFAFLLDRFMPKLDLRMHLVKKPLVSFAFKIPGRTPDATKSGVFLYKY